MAFPASNAFLYLCRGFSPTVWAVAAQSSEPIPRLCLRSQEVLVRDLYSKGGRGSMCVPVYGSMCVRPERWCRVCRLLDMAVSRDRNCGSVRHRALCARCLIVQTAGGLGRASCRLMRRAVRQIRVATGGQASEHWARATWVNMLLCARWEVTDLFLSLRNFFHVSSCIIM